MKKYKIVLLAMIPCMLWASVFPVVKTLLQLLDMETDSSGKIALAGMRFFAAGILILLTSIFVNKEFPKVQKKNWGYLTLIGLFQTTGLYGCYYIAIAFVTGVKASVLSQGGIFYMIILAYLFLGERIKRHQVMGILCGILGILVLNMSGLADGNNLFSFTLKGEGLLLISGVFGSLGQITAKLKGSKIKAMTLNGWQMTIGGAVLLVVGVVINGGLVMISGALSVFLMVYSILVAAVGFTMWYYLLQIADVNAITPYRLSIPVLGSFFSAIFMVGENITVNIVLGLVFVVVGMYVISNPKKMDN